jgi:hypothetical protein
MPLQGEGIDVWVQVDAIVVGDSTFKVLGPQPEGQCWAYEPDSIVRCVTKILVDRRTRGLFAVERVVH